MRISMVVAVIESGLSSLGNFEQGSTFAHT